MPRSTAEKWTTEQINAWLSATTGLAHMAYAHEIICQLLEEREWRPIETAPKDNRIKLTWAIVDDETGNWNMRLSSWREGLWTEWYAWNQPTHWMPLPEPPSTATRTE